MPECSQILVDVSSDFCAILLVGLIAAWRFLRMDKCFSGQSGLSWSLFLWDLNFSCVVCKLIKFVLLELHLGLQKGIKVSTYGFVEPCIFDIIRCCEDWSIYWFLKTSRLRLLIFLSSIQFRSPLWNTLKGYQLFSENQCSLIKLTFHVSSFLIVFRFGNK